MFNDVSNIRFAACGCLVTGVTDELRIINEGKQRLFHFTQVIESNIKINLYPMWNTHSLILLIVTIRHSCFFDSEFNYRLFVFSLYESNHNMIPIILRNVKILWFMIRLNPYQLNYNMHWICSTLSLSILLQLSIYLTEWKISRRFGTFFSFFLSEITPHINI